ILTFTLPTSEVRAYQLDIDKLLAGSQRDYLFVDSTPPATARKGASYDYDIKVRSSKSEVRYRLDSGPQAMSVSDEGKLTWRVPADFDKEEYAVIVGISDKSGREVFHSFTLRIGE